MISQIDNTGFHSAGKLIDEKKDFSDIDIHGFSQLCSLLIFSDKISVNEFESDGIIEKSSKALDLLIPRIGDNIINFHGKTEKDFYEICETAAISCANELDGMEALFDGKGVVGVAPTGLTEAQKKQRYSYLEIVNETNEDKLLEWKDIGRRNKMEGAIVYMYASSPELRTSTQRLLNKIEHKGQKITDEQIYELNAFLRCELNNSFALFYDSIYTPSIGRGKIVLKHYNHLVNHINQTLTQRTIEAINLKEKALNIPITRKLKLPPVQFYLLDKAKGKPLQMIDWALEAREHASHLRKEIRKITKAENTISALKDPLQFESERQTRISQIQSKMKPAIDEFIYRLNITVNLRGFGKLVDGDVNPYQIDISDYKKSICRATKGTLLTEFADYTLEHYKDEKIDSLIKLFYNV